MLTVPRCRRSAITFDIGAAGVRAVQFVPASRGDCRVEILAFERTTGDNAPDTPRLDAGQIERLVGQGKFLGRDVALVLSSPEVEFFPLRLPEAALSQPPERLEQALRWEVSRESRTPAEKREVRYWRLPSAAAQYPNIMAVTLPTETPLGWSQELERVGLHLARIDVSPCALVRIASQWWLPEQTELWGVLDLGQRHSTLTVVVGTTPTYIRSLSVTSRQWTQQLAEAFEVGWSAAEQLKRTQVLQLIARGHRLDAPADAAKLSDLPAVMTSVLRESLRTLAQETGRCFSYVMQNFPEHAVKGLLLAGGGARFRGLAPLLSAELGIPVAVLTAGCPSDESRPPGANTEDDGAELTLPATAHTVAGGRLCPDLAAALGAAAPETASDAGNADIRAHAGVNLVPTVRLLARCRGRRQRIWLAVCAAGALLVAVGWGIQRSAGSVLTHLVAQVRTCETRGAELQRRLTAAAQQRAAALEEFETYAAIRHPQPWPARLLALSQLAPPEVFLTGLTITPPGSAESRGAAAERRPLAADPVGTARQVRLRGYATDHAALIQLLNTLQTLPGWKQVDLVRATVEPFRSGSAVAFELSCLAVEDGS